MSESTTTFAENLHSCVIERLGRAGDGIAPGPVYVAGALPGEEVEGTITAGRMAAPRVLRPSPERVAPPCPQAGTCGGCALQHASDPFVARWKAETIAAALAAQGLSAPLRPILTSPAATRRRATLAARRTKSGVLLGFHARASETIVPLAGCTLLHPALLAALPAAEALTAVGASRKGVLSLTLTHARGGVDIAAEGAPEPDGPRRARLAALAGAHGLARLAWNGEILAEITPPAQIMGRARVVPPPGAFLQATAEGEAALVAAVREAVGGARRIADLFAGCGTFTLPLAETAEIHAAESAAPYLAALEKGWRGAPGLRHVSTEARDLFRRPLLAGELARFEAVVIDPPRAGAAAQVSELARSGVGRIAFVSCNPATFARDARTLTEAGYCLDWVQPVDQFRWSGHVELAAQLTRTHMS